MSTNAGAMEFCCFSFLFLVLAQLNRGTFQTCVGGSTNSLLATATPSYGTFLNNRDPIPCDGYITRWTFCYNLAAHSPGETYSLTAAVWSYDEGTEMYSISPSSIRQVLLIAGPNVSVVICHEATLLDNEIQVSAGDLIGVALPETRYIQVLYSHPAYNLIRIEEQLPWKFNASETEVISNTDLYIHAVIVSVDTTDPATSNTPNVVSTVATVSEKTEHIRTTGETSSTTQTSYNVTDTTSDSDVTINVSTIATTTEESSTTQASDNATRTTSGTDSTIIITTRATTMDELSTTQTSDNVTDTTSNISTGTDAPESAMPHSMSQTNTTGDNSNSGTAINLTPHIKAVFIVILAIVVSLFTISPVLVAVIAFHQYYKRRHRRLHHRTPLLGNAMKKVAKKKIRTVPNVAYICTKHNDSSGQYEELVYSSMVYNTLYPNYKPGSSDTSSHIYASITIN